MSLRAETVYADDTDAYVERQVTDNNGGTLDWPPMVAVDASAYDLAATWQGDPGPSRTLRVPIVGLAVGVRVAHAMEDCFVAAQQKVLTLRQAHIDLLLGTTDLLARIARTAETEIGVWDTDRGSSRLRAGR